MPNEGRERFAIGSPEYRVLRDWIGGGLKDDTQTATRLAKLHVTPREQILIGSAKTIRLQAEAVFADGARRDVSSLAADLLITGP